MIELVPQISEFLAILSQSTYSSSSADAEAAGAVAALFMMLLIFVPFVFYMCFIALVWILVIAAWAWTIAMLIDAVKRDFEKEDDKVLWVLIILLGNLIGSTLYYFIIKRPEDQRKGTKGK